MTLAELIEKRGHRYDDKIGKMSASDYYTGYMSGWKWAYQDLQEILEHNGFDMSQIVIPGRSNMEEKNEINETLGR